MDVAPGTILLGKYRVLDIIGTGGMGRVVRASHLYLQQLVAIKILLPEMAESASTVERFLREAQATVQLKSEHIARVIDVGTIPEGNLPFMIMEYLEGNDLNQILRHHGPQEPGIVCDLMLQACEGIAEAHAAGIIHRDIKPSNFFITRRPDGSMLLKILDFGISKTPIGYEDLTGTQTVIGTPSYMAPEQMKSGRHADHRSDIWSMGVVMYQLVQGRPPFSGESYAELVLKVGTEPPAPVIVPLPPGLGEVLLRCLEKDPKNRYQNVGELARMLAPFATDPITAAQIANRTTRILQARGSQAQLGGGQLIFGQQASPLTANGGLATPVPLSPAQLTPRSWPPSTSTVGGTKGQVTYQTRGNSGWLVAGALALVVLAGAGGFLANEMMKDDPPARTGAVVEAPPPRPAAAAPTPGDGSAKPTPAPGSAASEPPPAAAGSGSAATTTAPPPAAGSGSAAGPWKPTVPQPTIQPPTTTADAKPAPKATVEAEPEPKPATAATAKPATTATKAEPKPRPATAKPKPTPKPAIKKPKPKPTPADPDLFDRRD